MHRGEPVAPRLFGHLWLGVIVAVWLDAIIPFELFLLVPNLLAAPWTSLVRMDLGQVLFGFALLRLATGARSRDHCRPGHQGSLVSSRGAHQPRHGRIGCVDAHEGLVRDWSHRHPDLAEAALGVAVAVGLLLVSLWQWGLTDVGLSRGVSLGLPFAVATVWVYRRRRLRDEDRERAMLEQRLRLARRASRCRRWSGGRRRDPGGRGAPGAHDTAR